MTIEDVAQAYFKAVTAHDAEAVADFFTVDGGKIRRLAVYLGGQLP
jgi:hypothetical protein